MGDIHVEWQLIARAIHSAFGWFVIALSSDFDPVTRFGNFAVNILPRSSLSASDLGLLFLLVHGYQGLVEQSRLAFANLSVFGKGARELLCGRVAVAIFGGGHVENGLIIGAGEILSGNNVYFHNEHVLTSRPGPCVVFALGVPRAAVTGLAKVIEASVKCERCALRSIPHVAFGGVGIETDTSRFEIIFDRDLS